MIPAIGLVLSVEMIRDGGSLAATFQGTDNCEYWLFLPLRRNKTGPDALLGPGYEEPLILDRLIPREIPITWQQAEILLSQMKPLLEHERDLKWFAFMSEVVRLRGAYPRDKA
ncbi:hypothetical protein [Prosthecobacter sp.]|uniref:hypothetical protein n=1 Tax=Prosthecobacter sp. TaxID=1965333 RepID=UPI0037832D5B